MSVIEKRAYNSHRVFLLPSCLGTDSLFQSRWRIHSDTVETQGTNRQVGQVVQSAVKIKIEEKSLNASAQK